MRNISKISALGHSFGTILDGRTFGISSRMGFNGKEKDPETVGTNGNTYDYGFRIYNPSLAKFLSVDPLTKDYPMLTPYQFASNTPIQAIDIDGLEAGYAVHWYDIDGNLYRSEFELYNPNDPSEIGPLGEGIQGKEKRWEVDNSRVGYIDQKVTVTMGEYTDPVVAEDDMFTTEQKINHCFSELQGKSLDPDKMTGHDAGQRYIDNVGTLGEWVESSEPILITIPVVGPPAYEVAEILSTALNSGQEFMQTARDIDLYGLEKGFEKAFERKVQEVKDTYLPQSGTTETVDNE